MFALRGRDGAGEGMRAWDRGGRLRRKVDLAWEVRLARLGRGLRAAWPLALIVGLALLAAAAAIVGDGLADHVGRSDLAVVLGTKVGPDGRPAPALQARCDEAVLLYRRGLFPLILTSGAHGKEGFDEGTVMKRYLVSQGVPAAVVIADDEGVNTWATARNTAALMRARGLRSVTIVSQYYHVPRTRLAFRKWGIATIYNAHPRYWTWRDAYAVPREVAGWAEYLFRTAPPAERLSEPARAGRSARRAGQGALLF
jgi:uncharacterized SAM-binding protein YcdF (DUF218 family)